MILQCSLLIFLLLISSCSLFTRKGRWGEKAIYPVKWNNVKKSFVKNITSRHVWIPATAGLILQVDNYDSKITEWAERNGIWSTNSATDLSDTLKNVLEVEMYTSILFTSSSDGNWKKYTMNKVKGTVVVNSSAALAHGTTSFIKDTVYRERPDRSDTKSFPSGHSTEAAAFRMVTTKNLDSTDIHPALRDGINILNGGLTATIMWSRVEAKKHYPSDALAGYAIGSFMSGFIYDAFMNLDETESLAMFPSGDGGMVAKYSFQF